MSNYVTVAQLRAFKKSDGSLYDFTGFTDGDLQTALDESEELIEKVCHTRFYRATETWYFNGDDSKFLRFTPSVMYPVYTVSELLEVDADGDTVDTWVENEDFVVQPHYLLAVSADEGERVRSLTGRGYFPVGVRNFKITGLWGNSTPDTIRRVTKLLSLETLKPGVTSLKSGELQSESWPDYSVTYRYQSPSSVVATLGTGFTEIDRLLARYVNHAGLVMQHPHLAFSS